VSSFPFPRKPQKPFPYSAGDYAEVQVRSLGGLGEAIAFTAEDTEREFPIYIPFALPGEAGVIKFTRVTGNSIHGRWEEIYSRPPHQESGDSLHWQRQSPACEHFGNCGGCLLQHVPETSYQEFKTGIVLKNLRQLGFSENRLDAIHFLPFASRRRVDLRFHRQDGEWQPALFTYESHQLISIRHCAILLPELQRIIAGFSKAFHHLPESSAPIACELTAADNGVTAVIESGHAPSEETRKILHQAAIQLGLIRLHLLAEGKLTLLHQQETPIITVGTAKLSLPPRCFLQATKQAQEILTGFARDFLSEHKTVADLFCGIGIYAVALSQQNISTSAYEVDSSMVKTLQHSQLGSYGKYLRMKQRDLFRTPLSPEELNSYKGVVINPPRAGAKAQCEQLARSRVRDIVMISCHPATFVRDAKTLIAGGYQLISLIAIDQFVWSAHLEIAACFRRC
jgi:23S rRNA (uracil1939-C5)-methyltransferase